jgi:hypothetical protein
MTSEKSRSFDFGGEAPPALRMTDVEIGALDWNSYHACAQDDKARKSRSFDYGGEAPPALRMTKLGMSLRSGCG